MPWINTGLFRGSQLEPSTSSSTVPPRLVLPGCSHNLGFRSWGCVSPLDPPLTKHTNEGWRMPQLGPVLLTKPRLLVPLHLDGKAKVSQLDSGTFQLGCQQQVLGLQEKTGVGEEQKPRGDFVVVGWWGLPSTAQRKVRALDVLPCCFVLPRVPVSPDP